MKSYRKKGLRSRHLRKTMKKGGFDWSFGLGKPSLEAIQKKVDAAQKKVEIAQKELEVAKKELANVNVSKPAAPSVSEAPASAPIAPVDEISAPEKTATPPSDAAATEKKGWFGGKRKSKK